MLSKTMEFSNSVIIRRSRRDVFQFLANAEYLPMWNHAVTSARQLTPGSVAVGTRLRLTRSIPQSATDELEVVDLDDERRLVLRGDVGPLTGTLTYQLDEVPEGTRLTNAANLTARGPLRLLSAIAEPRVRAAVALNLERLRQVLERG